MFKIILGKEEKEYKKIYYKFIYQRENHVDLMQFL